MVLTVTHSPTMLIRNIRLPLHRWHLDEAKKRPLEALGITPYRPTFPMTVGKVIPDSPAEKGNLQQGDRIILVNGKKYNNMMNVVTFVKNHPGEMVHFVVLRNGEQKKATVTIGAKKAKNKLVGYVGFEVVMPKWPSSMLVLEKYSVVRAWKPALNQTVFLIKFNAVILGKMLLGKISTRSLGGPISIFQMAGQASQRSYRVYLSFLAFLSVTLGFINLLPIPGLDGGHFLFQCIELVFCRLCRCLFKHFAFE